MPRQGQNEEGRSAAAMATAAYGRENLSSYLKGLGGQKQLTREEEYDLSRRARKGEEAARQTLATSNLAFVVAVAKKFSNRGARLDDLIQEGNVGLMKAIEHFDPKKNVRFATYAVWWIRAYITRYLKDNRSQVRGGESERGSMVDFSLDTAIDEDGDTTFLDRLEEPGLGPQDTFLGREQDEDVQEALSKVRKRIGDLGWDIVQERVTQDKARTLEEVGRGLGGDTGRGREDELRTKHFLARYLSAFNQDEEQLDMPVEADAA